MGSNHRRTSARHHAAQIEEIGFECLVSDEEKPEPLSGACRLEQVSKAFLLDAEYKPGPSVWSTSVASGDTG